MSFIQQIENEDFERSYNPADRFAGFDRGDAGRDDTADRLAANEEFEEEMKAAERAQAEWLRNDTAAHYALFKAAEDNRAYVRKCQREFYAQGQYD